MNSISWIGAALAATLGISAQADPRVVADIAPVHSLVAAVMEGAGAPALIVPQSASPHGLTLRPSQAQDLAEAEIVFTVGEDLVPWLIEAADTLAPNAVVVELGELPGLSRPPLRDGGVFEAEHDADPGHDHDHAHGDPHYWLNPGNAALWADAIADALAVADPSKAALYRANAAMLKTDLVVLEEEVNAIVAPARGRPFVVFHDAYGHFEQRFNMPAAGAVALSDAARPGPARIAEIQNLLRRANAACVFGEPQFPDGLLHLVTEGANAQIGTLDPLGATLTPGPTLYPALLRAMASSLAACLAPRAK